MKLTAKAQRSDKWWAIEVPEIPGLFTLARRLDQVAEMVDVEVVPVLAKRHRA